MEISVCDMRGAGKPGYVAKLLDGNERGFLSAKSYSSHGSSRKTVTYEVSELEYGIYEICDANFGGRKRRVSYLAVAPHGHKEFENRRDAEEWLNPPAPQPAVQAAYPGLKAVEREDPEKFDVEISRITIEGEHFLRVKMLSDNGFKLFMPELKRDVRGRRWDAQRKAWIVPADSAMLLREAIEMRSIRAGIRTELRFRLSPGAKEMMAM